jgi:hypothetical protein
LSNFDQPHLSEELVSARAGARSFRKRDFLSV